MKHLIAILVMVLIAMAATSQDNIRLRNGETIVGKVTEVGVNEIKYYKGEHGGNGPVYVITKTDVAEILYQSGVIEKYNATVIANSNQAPVSQVIVVEQPASFYRRRPVVSLHLGGRNWPSRHHGIFRRHH